VKITLDGKADAKRAIAIMLECAAAHPRSIVSPKPLCWLREFSDSGLMFVLTFWIGDVHEGRNGPQSDVMLAILEKFRLEGIEFGYSQKTTV
jgi:small-conductance mechanosensitive channel